MGRGKPRHFKSGRLPTLNIECRSVGCGGTDVTMVPDKDGLKCIWENENCPYDDHATRVPNINAIVREARDGHNVSRLGWQELEQMVEFARGQGWLPSRGTT